VSAQELQAKKVHHALDQQARGRITEHTFIA